MCTGNLARSQRIIGHTEQLSRSKPDIQPNRPYQIAVNSLTAFPWAPDRHLNQLPKAEVDPFRNFENV